MPAPKTATGLLLGILCLPAAQAQIAADTTVTVETAETGVGGNETEAEQAVGLDTSEFALEAADVLTEESLKAAPPVGGTLLAFRGAVKAAQSDNIFLSNTNEEDDTVFSVTGGFRLAKGTEDRNYLRLIYDATARIYLDHDDLNDVDHDVAFNGVWTMSRTSIKLAADYHKLSTADREARAFTDRDIANAELSFTHDLSGKTVLDGNLLYRTVQYKDFNSSSDYSARLGAGYKISGKTTLGLAGVVGYLDSENNPEENYEQVLLTASYDASGKLTFKGDAGMEFRQYDSVEKGSVNDTGFVFSLRSTYQPRERTAFALTASRSTLGSVTSAGQSIDRTRFSLGVNQKLGSRFTLSMQGGYDFSDYRQLQGSERVREEDAWFGRSTLAFKPTERSYIEVFYEMTDISSTIETLSYETSQFGLSVGVTF